LLFMGDEYGETAPFFFFTSFEDAHLATAVREGRKKELGPHYVESDFADPQAESTFERSRLDWSKLDVSPHSEILRLHRDLISLRKQHPALANCRKDLTEIQFDERSKCLVMKRADPSGNAALLVCNFSGGEQTIPLVVEAQGGRLALRTGDPTYGGNPVPGPTKTLVAGCNGIALTPFEAAIYLNR
jgi:maltooligosyltrehalose trehalohydrolase